MSRRNDRAENIAEEWLRIQGFTDIQFVDDTNSQPPDFIVDKRIAVEVTRLTDDAKSLEEKKKSVSDAIKVVLGEFETCSYGNRVYVSCELMGGITEGKEWPRNRIIERQVRRATEEYMEESKIVLEQEGRLLCCEKELDCGIRMEFIPSKAKFILNGVMSSDTGFLVNAPDYINRCVKRKRDAIGKKEGRLEEYSEWWLVLTDDNANVFSSWYDEFEQQKLRDGMKSINTEPWARIYAIREPVSNCSIRLK